MKRKILWAGITVLISMSAMGQPYSGGAGTANDPYRISKTADMMDLAATVNAGTTNYSGKYFLLTADLTDIITIIGLGSATPFSGTFDGGGHRLTVNISTANPYAGVFGYAKDATILNLGVAGTVMRETASSEAYAGGICGWMAYGSITNCYNTATVTGISGNGNVFVGGIGGKLLTSSIKNSYNTGNVEATADSWATAGGIGGNVDGNSSVTNCFAANASVTASGSTRYAGRIAGYTDTDGSLSNNYALEGMMVNDVEIINEDAHGKEGYDATAANLKDLDWLSGTLGWDVSEWYIEGGLPTLKPSAYAGGIGTEGKPYLISSVADMEALAAAVNGGNKYADMHFLLTADLAGITTIIGTVSFQTFRGTFDGGGHTLTVSIENTGSYVGVFGNAKNAVIKNLGVAGSVARTTATGVAYVAGICAYMDGGSITACHNTAAISAASSDNASYAAGICGYALTVAISQCYNTGAMDATTYDYYSYAGGICGYPSSSSSVDNCYNTGAIASASLATASLATASSGGICGYIFSNTTISNCYNTGAIDADANTSRSGGICGNVGGTGSAVSNCLAANATITAVGVTQQAGRVVGYGTAPTDCYAYIGMLVNGEPISSPSANNGADTDETYDADPVHWVKNTFNWGFDESWYLPLLAPDLSLTLTTQSVTYGHQGDITFSANSHMGAASIAYTYKMMPADCATVNEAEAKITIHKAGTVTLTATLASTGDYRWSVATKTLTIDKAALTVTALPATSIYGDDLSTKEYTFTYAGFVNGENESVLSNPPTFTCEATNTSDAGDYDIVPEDDASLEDDNYTFAFVPGTLTINKRELTVTAEDATSIYGNELSTVSYTVTYSGFVNDEEETTPGVITTPPTITCSVPNGSDADTYPNTIVPSDAAADNYTFTYVPGKLTIGKRELTVTPDNKERAYGDPNPTFTVSYSDNFANGDTREDIATQPTATTTATATSPVGDNYVITCDGGTDKNYTFNCATGTLRITQAALTVTAIDASRAYGDANPAFTLSYAGWKNAETKAMLTTEPSATCIATETSPVGTYPIIASGGVAVNYAFAYVAGTLTVLEVYAVRIPASEGGRVTAEPSPAVAGKPVTLRIAPENGYALSNISVRWTAAPNTPVALSGEGDTRTFTMPAAGVTVSASFHKTADRLALDEAMVRLGNASFILSQEVLNTQAEAFEWLLDTLNVLLSDLNIPVPERNIWMYNFSPAVAGTPALPAGRAGGFAASVSLSKNGNYGAETVDGTILATRYVPVGIEAPQVDALTAYVRGGMLYVSGLAVGEAWSVYDISGKRVYHGVAAAVPLAVRGIYIIRTETRSVRVVY